MRVEERAARITMLVLDVDGVLTDGGLYYDDQGRISKRFHVQDGLGIKLAQAAGIEIAVISGLDSEAVRNRVTELGVTEYHAGHLKKIPLLEKLCQKRKVSFKNVAYLGDDWVDAGVMQKVGLPMAVANAQPEILDLAAWVATRQGGRGAVREAIRFLLTCQGKLDEQWQRWQG